MNSPGIRKVCFVLTVATLALSLSSLACEESTSTPVVKTATPEPTGEPTQPPEEAIEEPASVPEEPPTATPAEAIEEPTSVPPTSVPEELPTTGPEPTEMPKLGDVVEQDGYSLSVVAVEEFATSGGYHELKAGHKIIALEVVIGNISGEQFSSNLLSATLVDSEGFMYGPEMGTLESGEQMELLDINPGERVKGWIPFEVPVDTVPSSLKYEMSGYPEIVLQTGVLP